MTKCSICPDVLPAAEFQHQNSADHTTTNHAEADPSQALTSQPRKTSADSLVRTARTAAHRTAVRRSDSAGQQLTGPLSDAPTGPVSSSQDRCQTLRQRRSAAQVNRVGLSR